MLEDPDLRISNIDYPARVGYRDEFNISMILAVNAPVEKVNIRINKKHILNIESLEAPKSIIMRTSGKDFINQKEIIVNLDFRDLNNKDYYLEFKYPIEIINVPWYAKFLRSLDIKPVVL